MVSLPAPVWPSVAVQLPMRAAALSASIPQKTFASLLIRCLQLGSFRLLLRSLKPLQDFLRCQLGRGIITEFSDEFRNRREDTSLLLMFHEPAHELSISSLALRSCGKNSPCRFHSLNE